MQLVHHLSRCLSRAEILYVQTRHQLNHKHVFIIASAVSSNLGDSFPTDIVHEREVYINIDVHMNPCRPNKDGQT